MSKYLQLERMQAIVQSRGAGSPQVKEVLSKDLRSVAYRIEDALDGIMLHEPRHSPNNSLLRKGYLFSHNIWHRSSLNEIHEEIQKIRHEMRNIHEALEVSGCHGEDPRTQLQHHLSQSLQEAEILGIDGSKEKLMSQLISTEERDCSAVVMVGPPGSGKTVLVNSVYSDNRVSKHFRVKVCARLSRRFDVADVLSLLLSQTSHYSRDKTGDLANDLKNNLKGKRYLVLLDDVWSENHWRAIKHALPDDSNGSRVVITTAKTDVASSIAASSSQIHLVEGLKEEESWQLFCRITFADKKGVCPPDLVDLSREIVHKCQGSPLAVSAVASLLARKQSLTSEWTKVRDNLRAEMESNTQFSDLNNSILQSYDDLHGNLKSCLLYFSLFPEGYYIRRERLIRLWVAERFVNQTGDKQAEEVAEEYLNELIRRHLVVASRDFDHRVNNCRVTNFLHYFLTVKSRKEDFAAMLDKPNTKPGDNVRRLSVADALSNLGGVTGMRLKRVCTFITSKSVSSAQIIELSNQFKNLKVLDFQGAPLHNFPDCVIDLGLLRYLSLRGSTYIFEIPSSIKKLRYLEYLDLKHTSVTYLPKEICSLHNLRHLLVYHYRQSCYISFETAQGMKMTREIGSLRSLQKLTLLKAERHPKFFEQLGYLTQLQKLGLIELRRSDGKSLCKSLAKMKRLSVLDLRSVDKSEFLDLDHPQGPQLPCNMLQRVYLKGPLEKLPGWIRGLKSLVRIHLRWSRLETSPIDELQGLNNLIELHLADAFIGEKLEFGRDAFESLKVLQLEELTELSIVKVSKGSMLKLERLILCNCGKLKTLPWRVQRLSELKELVLSDMPVELTNGLRKGSLDQSKIKVYSSDAGKSLIDQFANDNNLSTPEQSQPALRCSTRSIPVFCSQPSTAPARCFQNPVMVPTSKPHWVIRRCRPHQWLHITKQGRTELTHYVTVCLVGEYGNGFP